jgi:hypothetical protein
MRKLASISFGLAFACATSAALADGFKTRDLTTLPDMLPFFGEGYIARVEAERVTIACLECEGTPMMDILIGATKDGTEGRLRSGETTIAKMEALCKQKSLTCTIEGLSIAPAVGYISAYPIGDTAGSTMVIMQDGDMLTVRSLAGTPELARKNAELIKTNLLPSLLGN